MYQNYARVCTVEIYFVELQFVACISAWHNKIFQIIIRRRKGLVRFGLLHVLSTNLCVWMRVLTKEVVEALEHGHGGGHGDGHASSGGGHYDSSES